MASWKNSISLLKPGDPYAVRYRSLDNRKGSKLSYVTIVFAFIVVFYIFLLIVQYQYQSRILSRRRIQKEQWTDYARSVSPLWTIDYSQIDIPDDVRAWMTAHPYKIYKSEDHPKDLNTTCRIRDFHPLSEAVLQHNHAPASKLPCKDKKESFSWISYENRTLHLSKHVTECYYEEAIRINDDSVRFEGKRKIKGDQIRIDLHVKGVQFIKVTCRQEHHNLHQYLLVDPEWFHPEEPSPVKPKQRSILVLVTESMSRLSFIRYLPKSYTYLKNNLHAVPFQMHHRTGDNSFPNIYTVLAGANETTLKKFDSAPLLFYKFKENGYTTYYSEDAPDWNCFNYVGRKGFVESPTDYYLRLFWLSSNTDYLCYYNTARNDIILPYLQYVLLKPRAKPIFAFNFLVSFSHNDDVNAWATDESLTAFLKAISEKVNSGELLLVTMGDHGRRFGKMMTTVQGSMEINLPFLAIATNDPKERDLLKINSKRLTSQYDVHETLKGLIDQSGSTNINRTYGVNLLLEEVPVDRTCEQAGIDDVYCTCLSHEQGHHDSNYLNEVAEEAVSFINGMLKADNEANMICATLELEAVESSFYYSNILVINFRTTPGDGLFQLHHFREGEPLDERMFSRVNAYGKACVSHDILRKYCYCALP